MTDAFTVIIGPPIEQMKTTLILNYAYRPKHLSLNLSLLVPVSPKIVNIFLKSHIQVAYLPDFQI